MKKLVLGLVFCFSTLGTTLPQAQENVVEHLELSSQAADDEAVRASELPALVNDYADDRLEPDDQTVGDKSLYSPVLPALGNALDSLELNGFIDGATAVYSIKNTASVPTTVNIIVIQDEVLGLTNQNSTISAGGTLVVQAVGSSTYAIQFKLTVSEVPDNGNGVRELEL